MLTAQKTTHVILGLNFRVYYMIARFSLFSPSSRERSRPTICILYREVGGGGTMEHHYASVKVAAQTC